MQGKKHAASCRKDVGLRLCGSLAVIDKIEIKGDIFGR